MFHIGYYLFGVHVLLNWKDYKKNKQCNCVTH